MKILKWFSNPPQSVTTHTTVDCKNCDAKESVEVIESRIGKFELNVVVLVCNNCGAQHTPLAYGEGNQTSDGLPIIIGYALDKIEP